MSSEEPSVHCLVTGGHLLHFLKEKGTLSSELQMLKQHLLQTYVKQQFQTKVKVCYTRHFDTVIPIKL